MNYRVIAYTLGWVLNCEAVCMILPLICAFIYGEQAFFSFLTSSLICLATGVALTIRPPKKKTMYAKEGFITVALSWIVMSIFGSIPFLISKSIPGFVDAVFETVSGFTTTGASILENIEALPKSILFWRSFTHWIGGMGVLVFLVALLPLSGGNNVYLLKAESTGPSVTKLVPRVKSSAKILYGIYLSITVMQIVLLLVGKMPLFDALTTTFGTVGTGGFGVKGDSMESYSPYIQNVVTVFMIISGIDFTFYYLILMRNFKSALHMEEIRTYLLIILASIVLISVNSYDKFATIADTVRHSAFQVGSIITTTGYSTANFDNWHQFSKMILLLLMFIGACAGSTGGGIKVSRIIIFLKSIVKEIKIAAHPRSTIKTKMNGRPIEHETIRAVNVYMAAYVTILAFSILLISVDNRDFTTNFTAVAATLNNIGPGFGGVGPYSNFAEYSVFSKIVLTINMLIGRLEIFPLLVLFSPHTWKK